MISVIRINKLYLQTVLIKQPGRASQYKMHVSNMFTVNFIFCPSKANAGRFKNISCHRNEPKPHKHMTNYRNVKLAEETFRLTAESKILYSTVWLKLFHPLFSQEKHNLKPSARRVRTFLGRFRPKKDFGGNETKSKAGQCKDPIIYSISSPLGLCTS